MKVKGAEYVGQYGSSLRSVCKRRLTATLLPSTRSIARNEALPHCTRIILPMILCSRVLFLLSLFLNLQHSTHQKPITKSKSQQYINLLILYHSPAPRCAGSASHNTHNVAASPTSFPESGGAKSSSGHVEET